MQLTHSGTDALADYFLYFATMHTKQAARVVRTACDVFPDR